MQSAPLWHVTLRAIQDWWNDNCLRLAASLAYYTALSLAPLVLLIVGVIGLVLDRQQVSSQLSAQLEGLIGPAGRELVTSSLAATSPQGGALATLIGLVTLLIGATAVFGELQATLNLIWEVRPAPTNGVWAGIWALLRERLFSLALVLALAFLLLVSLVISAALAGAAALFQGLLTQLLTDVCQGLALAVTQPEAPLHLVAEDTILRDQICIAQQQFLVAVPVMSASMVFQLIGLSTPPVLLSLDVEYAGGDGQHASRSVGDDGVVTSVVKPDSSFLTIRARLGQIPHARGRVQTAVSATEHETHLALLFVHIDANIFQGWSPLSAASTALGIVER